MWWTKLLLVILGAVIGAQGSPVVALQGAGLPDNFVIGGLPTDEDRTNVALVVSLRNDNENYGWVFSGSLISNQAILTVAQAVQGYHHWQVGLGNVRREHMHYYETTQNIIHPDYNPTNLNNNLAIIMLNVVVPPFVALPIQLPDADTTVTPMHRYYGFGITEPGNMNSVPNTLKHGFTAEYPLHECRQRFGGLLVNNNTWCGLQFNTGLCHGDQGGPLMHFFENYIIGMASFWMEPCNGGTPDVFVRIEPYVNWIRTSIN